MAKVIRDAANSVGNSKSKLGDFFRRLTYRKGRTVAITATDRKLAVIIYQMLTKKQPFSYSFSYDDVAKQRNKKLNYVLKTIKNEAFTLNDFSIAFA